MLTSERIIELGRYLAHHNHIDDVVAFARAIEAECADTQRLDALEADVAASGPLLIHNIISPLTGGYRGLGLGSTGRTLRQALDHLRAAAIRATKATAAETKL